MERRWVLLVTAALLAATVQVAQPAHATDACGLALSNSGACVSAGLGPSGVDLGASTSIGGSDGQASSPYEDFDEGESSPGGGGHNGAVDPTAITDTLGACRSDRCGKNGTPAITLTDLASFAPTTPTINMEPDSWALRGRPANAVAETTTNSHDGTLLGRPITVRFTPTSYHWNWGDGTSSTSSTPGGTWDDLGLPRFSETDTSHTYTRRGAVTITLTVDYTVEYRSGNSADWTTVTGTVASTTNTSTYVGTAKTVNVPDDCNAQPDGPGC